MIIAEKTREQGKSYLGSMIRGEFKTIKGEGSNMQKRVLLSIVILLMGVSILSGCEPIYPLGNIKVEEIEPLSQGTSVNIDIIYPYIGDTWVVGWKDQNIEIIEGDDIVTVSDLTVTGVKPGDAFIKVNATTVMYNDAVKSDDEERVYSTKVKITVK